MDDKLHARGSDQISGMLRFIEELYPVCRSITGAGVRTTLSRIARELPDLEVTEVPSGTDVFDWQVPAEWNIREAYLEGPAGQRFLDFEDNNLHVVSYSKPVDEELTLEELRPHLHTIPEHPDWIPYRTSYYEESWGFCLPHSVYEGLAAGTYRARIDSTLEQGSLTYGELLVPGRSGQEILIWSHLCHPSLANDNLSGLAVSVWWAKALLQSGKNRFSYRFVWGPGTIGSITWLARNRNRLDRIAGSLVTVLLGRPGPIHYKKSRSGDEMIDRVVKRALGKSVDASLICDFDPYGYDERQLSSPGINIPTGRLSRVPNGEYPEYHTSADNLDLISGSALFGALELCIAIGDELESAEVYENLQPYCEPQLGKRGLYRLTGGRSIESYELALLWVLNQSDGSASLQDIAERSGIKLESLRQVAAKLVESGLLKRL